MKCRLTFGFRLFARYLLVFRYTLLLDRLMQKMNRKLLLGDGIKWEKDSYDIQDNPLTYQTLM